MPVSGDFSTGFWHCHECLLCPDLYWEVFLNAWSEPVDLSVHFFCFPSSDWNWLEMYRAVVPDPCGTICNRSIMILSRRERAALVGFFATNICVLALLLHVGWDINSLSHSRVDIESRTLAQGAALTLDSCNSNGVTITTSHPVAKLPVRGVVSEV